MRENEGVGRRHAGAHTVREVGNQKAGWRLLHVIRPSVSANWLSP